jgi:hypothetical protein
MGKLTIKLSLFTSILISIFFLGCTHFIKVSTFAKYNKINNNFFQTFSNDSLEIAINFSGAHKYQDISTPKKIAVPPDILKSLKQVTKKTDYKLLLYSTSKHYNTYYGFIIKKEGTIIIKNNFAEYQNSANEKFLISGLYKYKKSINVVSVVSLPMHYVLFINSLPINSKNNSIDKFETDSTYLVRNTFAEISSILTDFNFLKKQNLKQNYPIVLINIFTKKTAILNL